MTNSFGQSNANSIIEKSKGTWLIPIPKYIKLEENKVKRDGTYDKTDSSLFFITDSSYAVTAVFEGKVMGIFPIEDAYVVMTQYGDYYITYSNITEVKFKEGDTVKRGDVIGKIMKVDDDTYLINFLLMKQNKMIEAAKWFKW